METSFDNIQDINSFDFTERKTILIAEDTESNFMLVNYFLKGLNVRLIRGVNGKEAVDLFLSGEKIDIVLMDIKMPVMDGYTAAKLIREHNKNIPIIAQTAYVLDKVKATESGCNGFLTKPFDKKRLLQVLTQYI
jgi:CheY-like chemotaxis protein